MPTYKNFRYTEKEDYIIIRAYCGDNVDVTVPEVIKGKPVTEISHSAFVPKSDEIHIANSNCKARRSQRIRSVQLPDSIVSLDASFNYCVELEEITIPKNVEHLDYFTFRQCKNLQAIYVDMENPFYQSRNGMLYSKDGKCLILCPMGHKNITSDCLVGVEEIAFHAFAFNNHLSSLTIPESVHTIHSGAFYCCKNLTAIKLHANIRMEGSGHFDHCESLDNVEFFNTEGIVPADIFRGCTNLRNISLHGKFSKIDSNAFSSTNLIDITIPQGVKTINQDAFRYCHELKNVTLPKSVSRIQKDAFAQCGQVYLPQDGTWSNSDYVTGTMFHVIEGSKADQFCMELGYSVVYM